MLLTHGCKDYRQMVLEWLACWVTIEVQKPQNMSRLWFWIMSSLKQQIKVASGYQMVQLRYQSQPLDNNGRIAPHAGNFTEASILRQGPACDQCHDSIHINFMINARYSQFYQPAAEQFCYFSAHLCCYAVFYFSLLIMLSRHCFRHPYTIAKCTQTKGHTTWHVHRVMDVILNGMAPGQSGHDHWLAVGDGRIDVKIVCPLLFVINDATNMTIYTLERTFLEAYTKVSGLWNLKNVTFVIQLLTIIPISLLAL